MCCCSYPFACTFTYKKKYFFSIWQYSVFLLSVNHHHFSTELAFSLLFVFSARLLKGKIFLPLYNLIFIIFFFFKWQVFLRFNFLRFLQTQMVTFFACVCVWILIKSSNFFLFHQKFLLYTISCFHTLWFLYYFALFPIFHMKKHPWRKNQIFCMIFHFFLFLLLLYSHTVEQ